MMSACVARQSRGATSEYTAATRAHDDGGNRPPTHVRANDVEQIERIEGRAV